MFTAFGKSNVRAFTVGACAGAASLSQYAAIVVSTVAAAGLVLLVLTPLCGLLGLTAGVFLALALRARTTAGGDAVAE